MRRLSLLLLFVLLLSWQAAAQQDSSIILTVQLSAGMNYLNNSTIFEDFEAAHPGVEVNVVYKSYNDADYIVSPWYDYEMHLDRTDSYTVQGDVLYLSVGEGWTDLSLEATRAGYVLDLLPLFNADSTADPSVYYPTVWQSAQWDGGLWLLPTSTIISSIIYDAEAFDAAGLTHPNENWTAAEFAHAADVLAPRNAEGEVIEPSYWGANGNDGALLYRYLEQPLYDANEFPHPPAFVRDETIEFANLWLPALTSGAMFNFHLDYTESLRFGHIALSISWLTDAYLNDRQLAPLPGGGGLVNINGLAVSARTEYPQLSYELASYLAADRRLADAMRFSWGGMTLARPDYAEVVDDTRAPRRIEPEGETYEQALLIMDAALHDGVPASELLYYEYFRDALFRAAAGELDIETALRDAEVLVNNNLAIAEARRAELTGIVPTPVPEVELAPGEIELTFFYQEGDTLLWQSFIQEFVDTDPEVGRIILKSVLDGTDYRGEGTDCFYMYGSVAQTGSEHFLDLAPLLAADASINPDDWLAGAFDSLQVENSIYAMPIDIRPLALWYSPAQIEAANIQLPETSSEFLDALNQLNSPALSSYQLGTSLLMLMAAQRTVPINYETNPIQIDFTSEATMAGIQQILDLAREGKIKYGSIIDFANEGFPDREAFVMDYVADSMFRDAAYLPLAFPAGDEYTPVNYQMMVGYISHSSQHPEACYRLLRAVAQSPELLNGIPALRSEALNSDYAAFFEVINQQLEAPNRILISSLDSQEDYMATYWLFLAFDRYVLEDANLLTELTVAEVHTTEFLNCLQRGESSTYECALATDPSLSS